MAHVHRRNFLCSIRVNWNYINVLIILKMILPAPTPPLPPNVLYVPNPLHWYVFGHLCIRKCGYVIREVFEGHRREARPEQCANGNRCSLSHLEKQGGGWVFFFFMQGEVAVEESSTDDRQQRPWMHRCSIGMSLMPRKISLTYCLLINYLQ